MAEGFPARFSLIASFRGSVPPPLIPMAEGFPARFSLIASFRGSVPLPLIPMAEGFPASIPGPLLGAWPLLSLVATRKMPSVFRPPVCRRSAQCS